MSTRAGDLNRRVTVQKRTPGKDSSGQLLRTWTDVCTAWARIDPLGGRELLMAHAVQAESTHKVTMRYRAAIDATMRIVYQGRIFNIQNVNDLETRHETLEIMCSEGANDG